MASGGSPFSNRTVVAEPGWVYTLMWVGFPVLGVGVGWLLRRAVAWLEGLPWVPLPGALKLIDSLPEPYVTIGAMIVGGVAGLVLASLAANDRLTVAVSGERVTVTRGDKATDIDRDVVSAAFLDGKRLVLLGRQTEELARESSDLDADRLREAFRSHGYPWRDDGDPHQAAFRRWVDGMPDLPPAADVLLRARERALHKDNKDDVADLRKELAKVGIVVREEKKRQYWRRTTGTPELSGGSTPAADGGDHT